MKRPRTIVNQLDKSRLAPHLLSTWDAKPTAHLRKLLQTARVVPPTAVPADVVTMNSRVVVRYLEAPDPDIHVLCYPNQDNESGLSVLSPLGAALLGARQGERITFMGARTLRTVIVEAIEYQPERAGHLDV